MNNVRIPAPPQIPTGAEKIGLVDYTDEIDRIYGDLMEAEYEKANIWPMSDSANGLEILREEIDESLEAAKRVEVVARSITENFSKAPNCNDIAYIKGNAISAICELLQVIAVCNKYAPLFDAEKKKGDGQ